MWHSHLNDIEIPETKRFIPKGFELVTTLSKPNRPVSQLSPAQSLDVLSCPVVRVKSGNSQF